MKKILVVIMLLMSVCAANAILPPQKNLNVLPEGTFRKSRNGEIVQYNSKGKKIGTYKLSNGRYVKIK